MKTDSASGLESRPQNTQDKPRHTGVMHGVGAFSRHLAQELTGCLPPALRINTLKAHTPGAGVKNAFMHGQTSEEIDIDTVIRTCQEQNFSHIIFRSCTGLKDSDLQKLAQEVKNLKGVDLTGCNGITNKGVGYLLEVDGLEHLNLTSCLRVDDDMLPSLVAHSNLQTLILNECSALSGQTLMRKPMSFDKTALKRLSLSACADFEPKALSIWLKKANQLETLDVDFCEKITPQVFGGLPNKHLKTLGWGGFENSSKELLNQLYGFLPKLTALDLSHSLDMTDNDLIALKQFKHLKTVNLSGCEQVTAPGIASLIASFRQAKRKLEVIRQDN